MEEHNRLMREIIIAKDANELYRLAAERFVQIADESMSRTGQFAVALSGGSTPKGLYSLLATEQYRSQIDWDQVYFFFGDERNVSLDDKESNFRMANEALLASLPMEADQVYRWETEIGDAVKIAADYTEKVEHFFQGFPRFDLILLGIGNDGHTASLFPHTPALDEMDSIAVANPVEKLDTTRLTLTFPVINNAENIMFLVSGDEKAEALKAVLEGESDFHSLPSQNVNPASGRLSWFIDEASAKLLTR